MIALLVTVFLVTAAVPAVAVLFWEARGGLLERSGHLASSQLLTSNILHTIPILLLSHIMCANPVPIAVKDGRRGGGGLAGIDIKGIQLAKCGKGSVLANGLAERLVTREFWHRQHLVISKLSELSLFQGANTRLTDTRVLFRGLSRQNGAGRTNTTTRRFPCGRHSIERAVFPLTGKSVSLSRNGIVGRDSC